MPICARDNLFVHVVNMLLSFFLFIISYKLNLVAYYCKLFVCHLLLSALFICAFYIYSK